ncbi:MAG: aminoacyl-tRNA hydrolase [Armatimonadota bacterium]|nr:MAG: aminoacyl-tRNA hydrolase [Armatimonadota bacterium]
MKIIVGLGNPGLRYRRTRHNFGFVVVGALAKQRRLRFRRGRYQCTRAQGQIGKERVLLVRPQTYMNASGRCLGPLFRQSGGSLRDLMVVCDDVNLDLGRMRLRRSGTAGGHKGLESIIKHLGTSAFPRLRLGVGQPPEWMDMMSYVLGVFRRGERPLVDEVLARAVQALETWVYHGVEEAMNRFNSPLATSVDKP